MNVPSGGGTSTLLHLLGGLERPSGGEVRLASERVDRLSESARASLRRRAVGFVLQAFHLVEELSAAEGQTLMVVTHHERIAATADRLVSMRDGVLRDETRLSGTGGDRHRILARLAGLEAQL